MTTKPAVAGAFSRSLPRRFAARDDIAQKTSLRKKGVTRLRRGCWCCAQLRANAATDCFHRGQLYPGT
ncbi:MAG: hypothetical protein ABIZ80_05760, partial [Bryobacteraceae bacterium]